jgi:parallel beta helix pectate lyase-like protein
MNKFRFTISALAIAIFMFAFASMAQAQATRTWVSGVGDDVNPCSRTAPCKTFAGAISKTAKDGEISVLDPGGFGGVTITKSITINGTHGSGFGSILAAGAATGVLINITDPADVRKTVRLVTLNINGASTGVDGIKILAGTSVNIEDCVVDGFTGSGIQDVRTTAGKLAVLGTVVRNTGAAGVRVVPGAGGSVTAMLENVRSLGSTGNGGYAQSGNVKGTLRNCYFVGNFSNGIFADGTGGELAIEHCNISHNGVGIFVNNPAFVVLTDSTLTKNTTSINAAGQVQVRSTGTNTITNNGANNLPTGTAVIQK